MGLAALVVTAISTVLALRESAEFDTTKAVITAVIAFVVAAGVQVCVGATTGTILVMTGLITAPTGQ